MKKIRQINYESLIIILFSILPLVDSINGILIRQGLPSVAILYKVMVLAILIIPVLKGGSFNKTVLAGMCTMILVVLFSMCVNYILIRESFIDTSYPIKLIFNVLMFGLLFQSIQQGRLTGETIYKIFDNNIYIMLACMFVPYILGLGNTIYSGEIGYKAFFYSNNELNATLIILFYFSLYKIAREINITSIIQVVGILICILMMATKSSMIVAVVGIVVFLVLCLRKLDMRYKTIIVIAGMGGLIVVKDLLIEIINSFISRQESLFSNYGGNLLAALTSGRIEFVRAAWEELLARPFYMFHFLFGNGFISADLTEMDFIDIFFFLGFGGLIITVVFFFWIYSFSRYNMKQDRNGIRLIGFLLILCFAFITGHVLFMASSGCYFVLYCCFIMFYQIDSNTDRKCRNDKDILHYCNMEQ